MNIRLMVLRLSEIDTRLIVLRLAAMNTRQTAPRLYPVVISQEMMYFSTSRSCCDVSPRVAATENPGENETCARPKEILGLSKVCSTSWHGTSTYLRKKLWEKFPCDSYREAALSPYVLCRSSAKVSEQAGWGFHEMRTKVSAGLTSKET